MRMIHRRKQRKAIKSTDADDADRQTGAVCQCNSADRNGMWYLFWYFSGPICCGCILSIHKACACTDPGNGIVRDFSCCNRYSGFSAVGTYHPEAYAYKYLNLVHFWLNLLKPFTVSVTWIARLAAVPFGVEINRTEKSVTEEEIISIVDEAHEQGVIQENEAEMIQNIISFNETEAHDIMTHRKNVVAFDEEILLKNMIDTMLEEGNSRYPVYEENIDNIKGIVHYKDALKFMTQNPWRSSNR